MASGRQLKSVNIDDVQVNYFLERRNVKYARMDFRSSTLLVVVPQNYRNEVDFLKSKKGWILQRHSKIDKLMKTVDPNILPVAGKSFSFTPSSKFNFDLENHVVHVDLTNESHRAKILNRLKKNLVDEVKNVIKKYAADFNVENISISVRSQRTRWASCSPQDMNMSFNLKLVFAPRDIIEYIVYHELTHLKEIKHNKRFWKIVASRYANYKDYEKRLFEHWILGQYYLDMLKRDQPE